MVVLIQDLHCNYEVQKHIAEMLAQLSERHGLNMVGVEGAAAQVHVDELAKFPDAAVRRQTADYLLQQGKITGPEFCAVLGSQAVVLEGIEDPKLYAANRAAVKTFFNEESQGMVCDLRETLEELKPEIYSRSLQILDARQQAFRQGALALPAYAAWLCGWAQKARFDLRGCPNLERYISGGTAAGPEGVDSEELFAELERMDRELRVGLYTNGAQRELDRWQQRLDVMEKLLNISATPDDLAAYRSQPAAFTAAALAKYLTGQPKAGSVQTAPDNSRLDAYLEQAGGFYTVADQRSLAFVDNLLARMNRHQTQLAAVVIGGYHTDEMTAELQRRGISFMCVKPRLERTDVFNPYFNLLQGKRLPLEKLLAKNQRILSLPTEWPTGRATAAADALFFPLVRQVAGIYTLAQAILSKKLSQATAVGDYYRQNMAAYLAANAFLDLRWLQMSKQGAIAAFVNGMVVHIGRQGKSVSGRQVAAALNASGGRTEVLADGMSEAEAARRLMPAGPAVWFAQITNGVQGFSKSWSKNTLVLTGMLGLAILAVSALAGFDYVGLASLLTGQTRGEIAGVVLKLSILPTAIFLYDSERAVNNLKALQEKFDLTFAYVPGLTRDRIFDQELEALAAKVRLWLKYGIEPHPLMLATSLETLELAAPLMRQLQREAITAICVRALQTAEQQVNAEKQAVGKIRPGTDAKLPEASQDLGDFVKLLSGLGLSPVKYTGKYPAEVLVKALPVIQEQWERQTKSTVGTYAEATALASSIISRDLLQQAYDTLVQNGEITAAKFETQHITGKSNLSLRTLEYLASPDAPEAFAGVDKKMTDEGIVYYLAYSGKASEKERKAVEQRKKMAGKYGVVFRTGSPDAERNIFNQDEALLERKLEILLEVNNIPLYTRFLEFSVPLLELMTLFYSPAWLQAAAPILASVPAKDTAKTRDVRPAIDSEVDRLENIMGVLDKHIIGFIRQGGTIGIKQIVDIFGVSEDAAREFLDYLASPRAEDTILAGIDKRISRSTGQVEYYQAYDPRTASETSRLATRQRKQLAEDFDLTFDQFDPKRLEIIFNEDMNVLQTKIAWLLSHGVAPHPMLLSLNLNTLWIAAPIIREMQPPAKTNEVEQTPLPVYSQALTQAVFRAGIMSTIYTQLKQKGSITVAELLEVRMITREDAEAVLEYLISDEGHASAQFPGVYKKSGEDGNRYELVYTPEQLEQTRKAILGGKDFTADELGRFVNVPLSTAELILLFLASKDAQASEAWNGVGAGAGPDRKTVFHKALRPEQIEPMLIQLRRGDALSPVLVGEALGLSPRAADIILAQLAAQVPNVVKIMDEDGTAVYKKKPSNGNGNKVLTAIFFLGVGLWLVCEAAGIFGVELPWLAAGGAFQLSWHWIMRPASPAQRTDDITVLHNDRDYEINVPQLQRPWLLFRWFPALHGAWMFLLAGMLAVASGRSEAAVTADQANGIAFLEDLKQRCVPEISGEMFKMGRVGFAPLAANPGSAGLAAWFLGAYTDNTQLNTSETGNDLVFYLPSGLLSVLYHGQETQSADWSARLARTLARQMVFYQSRRYHQNTLSGKTALGHIDQALDQANALPERIQPRTQLRSVADYLDGLQGELRLPAVALAGLVTEALLQTAAVTGENAGADLDLKQVWEDRWLQRGGRAGAQALLSAAEGAKDVLTRLVHGQWRQAADKDKSLQGAWAIWALQMRLNSRDEGLTKTRRMAAQTQVQTRQGIQTLAWTGRLTAAEAAELLNLVREARKILTAKSVQAAGLEQRLTTLESVLDAMREGRQPSPEQARILAGTMEQCLEQAVELGQTVEQKAPRFNVVAGVESTESGDVKPVIVNMSSNSTPDVSLVRQQARAGKLPLGSELLIGTAEAPQPVAARAPAAAMQTVQTIARLQVAGVKLPARARVWLETLAMRLHPAAYVSQAARAIPEALLQDDSASSRELLALRNTDPAAVEAYLNRNDVPLALAVRAFVHGERLGQRKLGETLARLLPRQAASQEAQALGLLRISEFTQRLASLPSLAIGTLEAGHAGRENLDLEQLASREMMVPAALVSALGAKSILGFILDQMDKCEAFARNQRALQMFLRRGLQRFGSAA